MLPSFKIFIAHSFLDMQCMHGPKCKIGSFCTVGRRLQEVNILGGLILPVWGTIEKALAKQVTWSLILLHLFVMWFMNSTHARFIFL